MVWRFTGYQPNSKGRTPLTYNLRAGQFRGPLRQYRDTTIINNNIFGYPRSSGCCNSFSNYGCYENTTPKWMNWMMGLGMGTSLLGGLFDMFSSFRQTRAYNAEQAKLEAQAVAEQEQKAQETKYSEDFAELKGMFDYKFSHIGDKYHCEHEDGTYLEAATPLELFNKIKEYNQKQTTEKVADPATDPAATQTTDPPKEGQGESTTFPAYLTKSQAQQLKEGTFTGTFVVHDEVRGESADLRRNNYTLGEINTEGYPKDITVGGYRYEFLEVKGGTAFYESKSGVGDVYRLVYNNGVPGLTQIKGDEGAGSADLLSKKRD